jgi:hypothetical protein
MAYDSTVDTRVHIAKVQGLLADVITILQSRGTEHDLSKFSSPEKEAYDELTPKLRDVQYGSEEYKEIIREMRPAIDHHYQKNRHHPEYYSNGIGGMSLIDLLEMLVDWKAASERSEKSVSFEKAFDINKKRFDINPQLAGILWNTACELDWV